MKRFIVAVAVVGGLTAPAAIAAEANAGQAQQVLDQSAQDQKHTFLLFYREDSPATRAMAQTLKAGVAKRADRAAVCLVSVTDPAEQAVVRRFGVSRAPLPFALAVAPNGAITGHFSQRLADADIEESFATPGMAACIKAIQEKMIVLVCVHASARSEMPAAVREFQSDPDFKDRLAVISVQASDPSEAPFLEQMEIDPATAKTSTIVFLAPPAVLVGKFAATATKAELAAALHKAGKCCDDPNCKHANGSHASKNPGAKRK